MFHNICIIEADDLDDYFKDDHVAAIYHQAVIRCDEAQGIRQRDRSHHTGVAMMMQKLDVFSFYSIVI